MKQKMLMSVAVAMMTVVSAMAQPDGMAVRNRLSMGCVSKVDMTAPGIYVHEGRKVVIK